MTEKQVIKFWETFAYIIPNGPFIGEIKHMLLIEPIERLVKDTNEALKRATKEF